MTKLQQIIIAINSFSLGILIPIFNLILLERGASLQTLPLLLGIYAITVLCLELPSGICADIYGRKTVFLISCVMQLISISFLIVSNNMVWLVFAIIFFGSGRAFSSGSLDALFIDQSLALHGEGCLAKVTARMAVLDGSALAVGGITGGILSSVTGTFMANILFRIVLTLMVFSLCLFFIKEQHVHDIKQRIPLIEHIRQGKQVVFSTSKFGFIFLGVFFVGFFLFTIETYWQPAFMLISTSQNSTWMLGIIIFFGFLAVTAGNTIVQKLLDRYSNSWWNIYNICRIIFAVFILVFSFQKSSIGFVAWFTGVYLMLGACNVTENTLINKLTPNNMRASVLSLNSLVAQIGVLCASIFSSFMILLLQFTGIWIVTGSLLGGYAIVVTVITNRKQAEKPTCKIESPYP